MKFVTGNINKLKETREILGVELENVKLDLDEIQGSTREIVLHKIKQALEIVQGPVIIEDTCLCFNALHELPGPYIKWFLESIGNQGLVKMLHGFDDKTAFAKCTFCYADVNQEPILFEGIVKGRIVEPRGGNFGWDPIFLPDGFDQTFGEMDKSVKNTISHRYRALEKLKEYLANKN
ncbi:hypothetical protein HDV06_006626 [Boothiomyces sp. JEL0866]|nr:hypothetical protein HDV06_006626 [Boothiomyces sp. JEL0866]